MRQLWGCLSRRGVARSSSPRPHHFPFRSTALRCGGMLRGIMMVWMTQGYHDHRRICPRAAHQPGHNMGRSYIRKGRRRRSPMAFMAAAEISHGAPYSAESCSDGRRIRSGFSRVARQCDSGTTLHGDDRRTVWGCRCSSHCPTLTDHVNSHA